MKIKVYLIMFSLLSFAASSQPKAKIGMSIDEVKALYPNANSVFNESNSVITQKETIYGLENEWGFRFRDEKVDWIYFHHYENDFNEENFAVFFNAAKKTIADYESIFGQADQIEIGDTVFKDPYIERHWGYDVITAKWTNAQEMKIKVQFHFAGGKAHYYLLFKIHFFDKEYPYFE